MPISFRMLTLCGFLAATALGIPPAHAAIFTNGRDDSSVCLTVRGGNTANGTPVQSDPCVAIFPQVWNWAGLTIEGIGTTGAGGKCLDVLGGGTADGTPVQLFQCNGTVAQQWKYSNGLLFNPHSDKCLDVGNGAQGTQARIRFCTIGGIGQIWVIR